MKQVIQTAAAPAAIGAYSQAIKVGNQVYISGQIPLNPTTMQLVTDDIDAEIAQVFDNLLAVTVAAGGDLSQLVKLNVYLTDMANFTAVSTAMAKYFIPPYPARAVIGVAALPKGARVEIDAVMVLTTN